MAGVCDVASERGPVREANEGLTEGQTRESKPVGVSIVWFFVIASVLAVIGMVVVLMLNNR